MDIRDMVTTMGDVHLGRKFRNGVPLHRLNEREFLIWEDFRKQLLLADRPFHIQPGDIFNEFAVPEYVTLRAAMEYKEAAKQNPHVIYIVLRGNHDASRDADKASSFDLFQAILADVENVYVVSEVTVIRKHDMTLGLMPWHPFKSSTELAHELLEKRDHYLNGQMLDAVVTHCEIKSFGGTDDNLLPLNVLKHCTKLVYNGHIHQDQEYEAEGVTVVVTGSMQPYAHGEDTKDRWYKTMHLEDALKLTDEELKNLNLRVLLREGEVCPEFDCLSLVTKRIMDISEEEEGEQEQVELEDFDMDSLFKSSLNEHGVGNNVAAQILAKFAEKKNA